MKQKIITSLFALASLFMITNVDARAYEKQTDYATEIVAPPQASVVIEQKEAYKLDDAEYKGALAGHKSTSDSQVMLVAFGFLSLVFFLLRIHIVSMFRKIVSAPTKLQFGLRLFSAALFIGLGQFLAASLCMLLPIIPMASRIVGITPEEQAQAELLNKIKAQFEEGIKSKGFIKKEEVDEVIAAKMKSFEGLDAVQLKGLLDGEKGVMAILKKQGEKLTALEEGATAKTKSFKSILEDQMKNIEKVFKEKSGEFKLSLKAPVVMTTENTTTGLDTLPDELIESFSEAAFVAKRQDREYVYDLANVRTVDEIEQFKTWLEEGDEEGAFAVVEEGGLKPLVSATLVKNYSEYRKVAGKYVVTEEFAKFRKRAYAIIQRIIRQKILRDKAATLTTSLLADAAPYTASALDGAFDADMVTDYHAIAAVAAQIEALNFVPDLLILNPQDKWRIGMLQGTDGHFYLQVPSGDPAGSPRIMGFNVRTSNKIPVGEFILGESGLWEIEQEGITVRMGYGVTVTGGTSNGGGNVTDVQSDLDHNRFRVIIENYFHNYIASNNAGSFVHGDFDVIKALLEV